MRMIALVTVAAFLLLTAPVATAQAVWIGPSGGGMMSVQEAAVLSPAHVAVGFACDNYDRDPLGIDIFECRMHWRMGVAKRFDFYGSYQIARALSVPGAAPVPASPMDIVVANGSVPRSPYRVMYWPMPYLTHASSRVGEMTPGEYTFGIKALLTRQHRWQPAVATSLQVSIPGDMGTYHLGKGSGSGSVDVELHGAATWTRSRLSVSTNAGLTRNADLRRGDRFILDNGFGVWSPPIKRPDFLHLGIGARVRVWRGINAMVETSGWLPVGAHTSMLDESGARDGLCGIQVSTRGISFTAAMRQHLNPQRNGTGRPTGPLAGAVDLSHVSPTEQTRFLQSIGIDSGLRQPGSNLVVVRVPAGTILPPGATRISPTYTWHTTGNGGFLFSLSLMF